MSKKLIVLGAGIAMVLPLVAMAQIIPALPPSPVTTVAGIVDILNFVLRIVFTVLLIVAIAFILFAAFKYLTAMGDPAKVMEAHKALLWAAVAIGVALIATGVRAIVETILRRQG